MVIPTGRALRSGILALFAVLVGRGEPWSLWLAWAILFGVLAGFVADGLLARTRPRLDLRRQAPNQLHVDQPHTIA